MTNKMTSANKETNTQDNDEFRPPLPLSSYRALASPMPSPNLSSSSTTSNGCLESHSDKHSFRRPASRLSSNSGISLSELSAREVFSTDGLHRTLSQLSISSGQLEREDQEPLLPTLKVTTDLTEGKAAVCLRETRSTWLLDLEGNCISVASNDSTLDDPISKDNDATVAYKECETSDNYTRNRDTFTYNRKLQTDPKRVENKESQASMWDMYDSYHGKPFRELKNATLALERSLSIALLGPKVAMLINRSWPKPPLTRTSQSRSPELTVVLLHSDVAQLRVQSIVVNPFDKFIIAASYKGVRNYVGIWNLKNPQSYEKLLAFSNAINCLSFHPTHPRILALAGDEGQVYCVDIASKTSKPIRLYTETPHRGQIYSLMWLKDVLLSTGQDGCVMRWNIENKPPNESIHFKFMPYALEAPKPMPNEKEIVCVNGIGRCLIPHLEDSECYGVGTDDGRLHWCSTLRRDKPTSTSTLHAGPITCLIAVPLSPGKDMSLISSGQDGDVSIIYNCKLLQEVEHLPTPDAPAIHLDWQPSRRVLGTVRQTSIQLWSIAKKSNTQLAVIDASMNEEFSCIAFLNEKAFFVGTSVGEIRGYWFS